MQLGFAGPFRHAQGRRRFRVAEAVDADQDEHMACPFRQGGNGAFEIEGRRFGARIGHLGQTSPPAAAAIRETGSISSSTIADC